MKTLILLLTLISYSAYAKGYEAYSPDTGQTIYYTQEGNGFNAYNPDSGQTTYFQAN